MATAIMMMSVLLVSGSGSGIPSPSGHDETGEGPEEELVRCGWQEETRMCRASWHSICRVFMARDEASAYDHVKDGISADFVFEYCWAMAPCAQLGKKKACETQKRHCFWLGYEEETGICHSRMEALLNKGFMRRRVNLGKTKELEKAFVVELDRRSRECEQTGLQSQEACDVYGKPCMWRRSGSRVGKGHCSLDVGEVVGNREAYLAELFMVDHFCKNIGEQSKCVNSKDMQISNFQIIPQPDKYKVVIVLCTAVLAVLCGLCCKMPKPPNLKGGTYRKRRIIQTLTTLSALR